MTNGLTSFDPIALATHAAQQSDRWLFLFCSILLFLGCLFAIRWLLTRFDNLLAELRESNAAHAQTLLEMTGKVVAVVERNSLALEQVNEAIRYCRESRQMRPS